MLAPTRELAVQVAEATHRLGRFKRLSVLPVYGGQPIYRQLQALGRGVQVVIGTPGRVLDHLRRGTLDLERGKISWCSTKPTRCSTWALSKISKPSSTAAPAERQTALFSATHPAAHRGWPASTCVMPCASRLPPTELTVPAIEQWYVEVSARNKLDALTRMLDHEDARVGDDLRAHQARRGRTGRGVAVAGLHRRDLARRPEPDPARPGDATLPQRAGRVAGGDRGGRPRAGHHRRDACLQLRRSPKTPEAYVHRIGRTGRAGRTGKAITLVQPNEIRLLRIIERSIGQKIRPLGLPTLAAVAARRREVLKAALREQIATANLAPFLTMVDELAAEFDLATIAAAAAKLATDGERPLAEMVGIAGRQRWGRAGDGAPLPEPGPGGGRATGRHRRRDCQRGLPPWPRHRGYRHLRPVHVCGGAGRRPRSGDRGACSTPRSKASPCRWRWPAPASRPRTMGAGRNGPPRHLPPAHERLTPPAAPATPRAITS